MWRRSRQGMSVQETQEDLGLSTSGSVYSCKRLIETLVERKRLTDAPSVASQSDSGVRGFLQRHRKSLSRDTRDKLKRLAEEHQRVANNEAAAVEEAVEKERTSGLNKGEPGIYVYSFPHYMRYPVMPPESDDSLGRTYLKVGMSAKDVKGRVQRQITTALPEPPIVLRRYVVPVGDPDYRKLEAKIHKHLNAADHSQNRRRGAGKEWFLTHLTFIDSTADLLAMKIAYEDEAYPADYES